MKKLPKPEIATEVKDSTFFAELFSFVYSSGEHSRVITRPLLPIERDGHTFYFLLDTSIDDDMVIMSEEIKPYLETLYDDFAISCSEEPITDMEKYKMVEVGFTGFLKREKKLRFCFLPIPADTDTHYDDYVHIDGFIGLRTMQFGHFNIDFKNNKINVPIEQN